MTKRNKLIIWGAVIAVFAGILVAQIPQQKTPAQPVQSSGGRYQIVITPSVRADTFLLDTATGKVWTPITYTNLKGRPTVWEWQPRLDNAQQDQDWTKTQEFIPPPQEPIPPSQEPK